jgi:protein gp37
VSENTKIEWAHHTFNPWEGCTKVGPGCDHCYAETRNKRFHGGNWGVGAPRRRTSEANWKLPLKWNREAAKNKTRYRVFCASLADVFDNEVDQLWREDLWTLIEATPNLDWLLLTKRIGNVPDMVPSYWLNGEWPSHAWLGATVVNQLEADRDIPKLIRIPAKIRFLSIEPMLGPIDLNSVPIPADDGIAGWTVDWVICGGESGTGARPMHPQWARSLRDQCVSAGVKFHFKQWGEWAPRAGALTGGGTDFSKLDPSCEKWPNTIRLGEHGKNTRIIENCTEDAGQEVFVQRVGRKLAGRIIDGRTWNEFPAGAA